MSIKVTEETIERGAYSLTLKLDLNYINTNYSQFNCQQQMIGISSKINIDDRIEFQAMFLKRNQDVLNFVRFINLEEDDKTVYKIRYKQTVGNETDIINKQFTADDSWHSVGNVMIPATYVVELKNMVAPLKVSYAAIHDDKHFTDFELRGVDGSVHMHKAVAAACSPYFKDLFTSNKWKDTTNRIVDVPDTSMATLQQLKDYMYLGTVSGDTKKLLLLSALYMMPDLEKRCVFNLSDEVTVDTAYDLINFAANHKMAQLLFEILRLIRNGMLDINEMIKLHKP